MNTIKGIHFILKSICGTLITPFIFLIYQQKKQYNEDNVVIMLKLTLVLTLLGGHSQKFKGIIK